MAAHKKLKKKVFVAVNGVCVYCRRNTTLCEDGLRATVDHMIPVSRGGSDDISNLVNSCDVCNNMKGDMLPYEWEQFCKEHHEWWHRHREQGLVVGWLRARLLVREVEWPWLRELIRPRVMQTGFCVWGR